MSADDKAALRTTFVNITEVITIITYDNYNVCTFCNNFNFIIDLSETKHLDHVNAIHLNAVI